VIAIIDYGRGNLGSVEKAFGRVGMPAVVTQDARVVDDAEAVVLPGDGAFHDAMANLGTLGLLEPLRRALDGNRPFLGICLGYQLLFSASEEFGQGRGLDVIPGLVRRFPPGRKVPHMGWNSVVHGGELQLFDGIPDGAHFYFVHSYYPLVAGAASPDPSDGGRDRMWGDAGAASPDPSDGGRDRMRGEAGDLPAGMAGPQRGTLRAAWCEYGVRFAAAVESGRIAATQFHPEKSQRWGLRLLANFAALVKDGRR
jgi:glutamine amidotransferase